MHKNYTSLGLMSGTSGDGVDASIINSNGIDNYEVLENKYFGYGDEIYDEIHKLKVPFGFKLNGFITTKPKGGYTSQYKENDSSNPNSFLGQRKDLDPTKISIFAKKFKEYGATILGGCCETNPSHIKAIAKIK